MDESRIKALEVEIQRLTNSLASMNFKVLGLEKKLNELTERQPAKQSGVGIPVWEAYRSAYMQRYKFEPARNAKVNRNCSDIAKRIGKDAPAVVEFYVLKCNDPQWVRLNHPIGILLMNCESVYSMWKQGGMVTRATAARAERRTDNMSASQAYLQRKHGGTDEQR